MKILISPDKFKGSLTAWQVSEAIEKGIQTVDDSHTCILIPLADGGDGTYEVLTRHFKGEFFEAKVYDPLFRWTTAGYGYDKHSHSGFLEMAEASGLEKLVREERNCYHTSTFGTGQLMLEAYQKGARKLVLGIGGSATCDGGIGMAAAFGYQFLDRNGSVIPPVGRNLRKIAKIMTPEEIDNYHKNLEIVVLSDVKNMLYGPNGAAYVYGPQKGANESEIKELDLGLRHLADCMQDDLGINVHQLEGGGASGGLGAGLYGFMNATIVNGAKWIATQLNLSQELSTCDLVITGEGKIDQQTAQGKVIGYICKIAGEYDIPVIAYCGTSEISIDQQKSLGLTYVQSIVNKPMSLEDSIRDAYELLVETSYNVANLFTSRF